LPESLIQALGQAGYLVPTPIQAATIPSLMAGRDCLGQAQTGTGKTAAFALPLLARLDPGSSKVQTLVLTPTRELAIQVTQFFRKYASQMHGLKVATIYGGQSYATQIAQLKRAPQVVVGTPGRVIDLLRQGALKVDSLAHLVLDEADEMLQMGFFDDVQWILSQTPADRQMALFSATMPEPIRRLADQQLKDPVVIRLDAQQEKTIRQRYLILPHRDKFDAMVRILESEPHDGVLVFVKTKLATIELAENLAKQGYRVVALNGDLAQAQRERVLEQLKSGAVNVVVATDVAARGLDVSRISHVVNYDLPIDIEAYVHRIGRTGRAGRNGEAILFVAPRERDFLKQLQRQLGKVALVPMQVPDAPAINALRARRFKDQILRRMNHEDVPFFRQMLAELASEQGETDLLRIAAALASQINGDRPFLVEDREASASMPITQERRSPKSLSNQDRHNGPDPRSGLERFRVEVGGLHGVKPGNIVGAIVNEAGIDNRCIGHIAIFDEYSTVDLPSGMPREVFRTLGRAWVAGRQLRISKLRHHERTPEAFGGQPKGRPFKKQKKKRPVASAT
jgi:ATP-dependent RNA helicase DeaD